MNVDQINHEYGEHSIAIIGMAGRFPKARNIRQFWDNISNGRECTTILTEAELIESGVSPELIANRDFVRSGAFLEQQDCIDAAFFGLNPREASIMDPQHRQLLEVSWETLEDAGIVPQSNDASIGVFAGSGFNGYLTSNVLPHSSLLEQFGFFALRHASNDKDFLATRISYQFDLRGPSINVQTACSTSLVAIHMACQSLLAGECDIALAGAASIDLPHRRGYLYREGEVASPDGHCKPFSADSNGTFFGSGAAMVALKSIDNALADGDHIHAVIRGSAINNDGSSKVSYLAPSVDSQAEAIAEAVAISAVEPASIGYVEAHGTGTPLGDPIEFAALKEVYGSGRDDRNPCFIGSVKGNIGHLDTAAGIAGLIKTVEMLKHKQIPPSLHCDTPNPALEIEGSGMEINTKLRSWDNGCEPRRAGVTSLGVGGTNAHIVLEEHIPDTQHNDFTGYQLLPFSAKNDVALGRTIDTYCEYLSDDTAASISKVARTLQSGRHAFDSRSFVVSKTISEARDRVREIRSGKFKQHSNSNNVCFMFAGGGAQYHSMGADLYHSVSLYRETIDRCLETLDSDIQLQLKDVLCKRPEISRFPTKSRESISRPTTALPALFAAQLAQATVWQNWGITPAGVIGHSMGEYTAACIAGVFDMPTAMSIVIKRAELFESLPRGAMLSVASSTADIADLIVGDLSVAAINGPDLCVLSGPVDDIGSVSEELERREIDSSSVPIAVAAHSSMLDPILDEFESFLEHIDFCEPLIPIVSNLTGDWAEATTLNNPQYWVRHLRETVQFADGIEKIQSDNHVMLEVGPGSILNNLILTHTAEALEPDRLLYSMRRESENFDDHAFMLNTLGNLWSLGVDVNWLSLHNKQPLEKTPLPTYPFESTRHWLDVVPAHARTDSSSRSLPTAAESLSAKSVSHRNIEYAVPIWSVSPLLSLSHSNVKKTENIIIVHNQCVLGNVFIEKLQSIGIKTHCISFCTDETGNKESRNLRETNEEYYRYNIESIVSGLDIESSTENDVCIPIVHLLNVDFDSSQQILPPLLKEDANYNTTAATDRLHDLLSLMRTLENFDANFDVTVVSNNMQQVGGESDTSPDKAVLLGPVRALPAEMPNVALSSVDLQLPDSPAALEYLASLLLTDVIEHWQQIRFPTKPDHVNKNNVRAFRAGQRYEPVLQTMSMGSLEYPKPQLSLRPVCLITGGLGGLGFTLAKHLAANEQARLVLIGRRSLPPLEDFEKCIAECSPDHPVSVSLNKLRILESLGADVLYISTDIADYPSLQQAVAAAQDKYGSVNRVYHTAGILNDGLTALRSLEDTEQCLAPKVQGTINIERALATESLELFVLYSSTSAHLSVAGQADYSAANAFLNAFARFKRAKDGTPAIAIAWDRWETVGMATRTPNDIESSIESQQVAAGPLFTERCTDKNNTEFKNILTLGQHWILNEHRMISGGAIIPGTAYLGLIVSAFEQLYSKQFGDAPGICIEDVSFISPCEVRQKQSCELVVSLAKGSESSISNSTTSESPIEFVVKSRSSDDSLGEFGEQVVNVTGQISSIQYEKKSVDLHEIRQRCSEKIVTDVDKHPFIQFGKRWDCVDNIGYGNNEALIKLCLDDRYSNELNAWRLHPSLFDMATGAAYRLLPEYETASYVPLAYGSIVIFSSLDSQMYSHVQLVETGDADDDTVSLNVSFYDYQGVLIANIENFCLRRVESHENGTANHDDNTSTSVDFQEQPGYRDLGRNSDSLVELATELPKGLGIKEHEGIDFLDRLCGVSTVSEIIVSPRLMSCNTSVDSANEVSPGLVTCTTKGVADNFDKDRSATDQSLSTDTGPHSGHSNRSIIDDSGKPRSQFELRTNYLAPETETQKAIASIWESYLGVNGIGIEDNFFDLGGHSLLITQTLPQVRKITGKKLPLSKALKQPTIAQWSELLTTSTTKPVPIPTPAKGNGLSQQILNLPPGPFRYLHHRSQSELHHWNIATLLESQGPVNVVALKQAVKDLYDRHDALRLNFVKNGNLWTASTIAYDESKAIDTVNCSAMGDSFSFSINADAETLQASLSLQDGHLLRVRLYQSAELENDRLLVFVHHLVNDAYSWNLVLMELQRFYKLHLDAGKGVSEEYPVQYSTWSEGLMQLAKHLDQDEVKNYWKSLPWKSIGRLPERALPDSFDVSSYVLEPTEVPSDKEASVENLLSANINASSKELVVRLDNRESEKFVTYLENLGSDLEISDAVLATIGFTLATKLKSQSVLFDVLQLGREDGTELDLSQSIGFFVSYSPVLVSLDPALNNSEELVDACTNIRHMRDRGIEHDLLRFLPANREQESVDFFNSLPSAQILFNYLGHRVEDGAQLIDDSLFSPAQENPGSTHAANGTRSHRLAIKCGIDDQCLYMVFVYSTNYDNEQFVSDLANSVKSNLIELTEE